MNDENPHPEWTARAVLYGDGAEGSAFQIHALQFEGKDTGILMINTRANRSSPFVKSFTFADQEFASFNEAKAAYEAANTEKNHG